MTDTPGHTHAYCYICGWHGCATHYGHGRAGGLYHCPACCNTFGDKVRLVSCKSKVTAVLWRPTGREDMEYPPRERRN